MRLCPEASSDATTGALPLPQLEKRQRQIFGGMMEDPPIVRDTQVVDEDESNRTEETVPKNGGDNSGDRHVESSSIREMLNYDVNTSKGELTVKIICLGDSAVGKSKFLERFLINSYKAHQVSTYALTMYRYNTVMNDEAIIVDFWDTAGQERFHSLHKSYYYQAHACIMVFGATRKVTYKNLSRWYDELRQYRPEIPCFCAANKIDANLDITKRQFAFAAKNDIPFYFVSASDGTNVVKLFREAISAAVKYKKQPTDWQDQVLTELEKTTLTEPTSNSTSKDLIDNAEEDNDPHSETASSQEKTNL